jgi:hypothetical protein
LFCTDAHLSRCIYMYNTYVNISASKVVNIYTCIDIYFCMYIFRSCWATQTPLLTLPLKHHMYMYVVYLYMYLFHTIFVLYCTRTHIYTQRTHLHIYFCFLLSSTPFMRAITCVLRIATLSS